MHFEALKTVTVALKTVTVALKTVTVALKTVTVSSLWASDDIAFINHFNGNN